MIRVLVVDDHAVVRQGLSELLGGADDIEVIGTATGGEEGVSMARDHQPDVVLMDLSMPDLDGVVATQTIVAERADAKVVILTSFSEHDRIVAALDAGAIGYLLKDAEPDELLRGVRAAARGEAPFSPRAAQALVALRRSGRTADDLTAREREVLGCVGRGLSNKAIGRALGISEKTVKAHLTSVFATIGVSDRTQAALWAQRHGLRG
jgi:DNA-binding NarL/FixJ family response regulator